MSDDTIAIIFDIVVIICFILTFRLLGEEKKLLNLSSKKYGTPSLEDINNKMSSNFVTAPFYAITYSIDLLPIIFKKYTDPELKLQARKVKKYIYIILILTCSLITFVIINGLLFTKYVKP